MQNIKLINRHLKTLQKDDKIKFYSIKNHRDKLFDKHGIYCFWWEGDHNLIKNANIDFVLKGSRGIEHKGKHSVDDNPIFLYIGKSTNLYKRFLKHRQASAKSGNQLFKGIQGLFPEKNTEEVIKIINTNVSVSYSLENNFIIRFYAENMAIGRFIPWFNIDCER